MPRPLEIAAQCSILSPDLPVRQTGSPMRPTADPKERLSRKRAATWLAGAGLRPTRQRLALAELLVGDGKDRHVCAEGLFEAVCTQGAAVSLATVYNTLRAFCDAGLLSEVKVDSTRFYFDTRLDDHAHYFWEDDGRVTDAPPDAVRLDGPPLVPAGTELSRVDVVIRLRRKPG
jgi:Fur family transcriptional regulator, iron response regulator